MYKTQSCNQSVHTTTSTKHFLILLHAIFSTADGTGIMGKEKKWPLEHLDLYCFQISTWNE